MKQNNIKQIAKRRIQILFDQAKLVWRTDAKLAMEYVASARKIAMAAKTPLPTEFKRASCKKCNSFFVHGVNCRVRVKQKREPHIVVTCLNCGNQTRMLLREKGAKQVEQDYHSNEASR